MKKILIVDDSRGWVKYHRDNIFANYNDAEIDSAYSAREGYDWVYHMLDNPYDLIITDLHMEYDFDPKYAGEWFVEQIKLLKQYSKTKIIICSASYDIKKIAEDLNVNYIPKSSASRNPDFYKLLF